MDYDFTAKACGVPVFLKGLPSGNYSDLDVSQMARLSCCIARGIAFKPARLGKQEIAFLREFMGLTIEGISKIVNLDSERIEFMEQDHSPVSGTYEFAIRHLVMDDLGAEPPATRIMFAWSKEFSLDQARYRIDSSNPDDCRLVEIEPA